MAHSRTNGRYYKDNPEAVRARDAKRMYVNGKEISKFHPLHKPGKYASWQDAWNNNEIDKKTSVGFVYAIGNPAWPEWVKIGKALDAMDRLNGYQTSSPLRDYYLLHRRYFEDRNKAESIAHETLINEGHPKKGEWFLITYKQAVDLLDSIDLSDRQQDLFNEDCS